MDINHWSLFIRKGGDKEGFVIILASKEYHFNRVHEIMMQHPSNYISIPLLRWGSSGRDKTVGSGDI